MFSGVALRKTLVGFVCLGTRTLTRRRSWISGSRLLQILVQLLFELLSGDFV